MKPLTINVDIDGVLYDFVGAMKRYVEARHYDGGRVLPVPTSWNLWEEWGIDADRFAYYLSQATRYKIIFRHGADYPGAFTALQSLRKEGHHIRLVSHKVFKDSVTTIAAQTSCLEWLKSRGLRYDSIAFVGASTDKALLTADVIVDDKPVEDWTQPGKRNILFTQPWNEKVQGTWFTRGHDWKDVVQIIRLDAAVMGGLATVEGEPV